MKFLTNPYFYIPTIIVVGFILFILWYRWRKCQEVNTGGAPTSYRKCNFFTGKPSDTISNEYFRSNNKCYKTAQQSNNHFAGAVPPTEVDMCHCDRTC